MNWHKCCTVMIMNNAVIYARFSSSNQREESIEGQVRDCTAWAAAHGYNVLKIYTDKAFTGRTDRRPGFQQMISDAEKHLFDAVICWKTDRFARNRYDAALYKHRLKRNGVRLFYAMEAIPEGAEGIILESVMEGFAEYYSANLAENVRRGNYDSALQHKTLGKRVLGYRTAPDGTFEIDPRTAPIIKRIFTEYAEGRTMKQICDELNADGFKTAGNGRFNKSSLGKLLKNEKYIGTYRFADICDENVIPPLVTRELFDACQRRLETNKRAPRCRYDVRYMLTGKVFCGHCGAPMTGDNGHSSNGRIYHYYTCNNRRKKACDKKREPKEQLEKFVITKLFEILHDDNYINELADIVVREQNESADYSELNTLRAQLVDVETKIQNVMRAIEAGIFTTTTKEALQALENERAVIQSSIDSFALETPKFSRADIVAAIEALRDGRVNSPEYTQIVIDTFLNAVYVYDDGRVILHLNFIESPQITFKMHNNAVRELSTQVSQLKPKRTTHDGVISLLLIR